MNEKYNASNIKVLKPEEIKFLWVEVARISETYSKPKEFVDRVLESCLLYGKTIEWFESVYCLKDGLNHKDDSFSKFHAERLKELVP